MHDDMNMTMSMPLLPLWLRVAWTFTMCAVAVLHAWHAWVLPRQARWWHAGHTLMAAGMAGMYATGTMPGAGLRRGGLLLFAVAAASAAVATLTTRRSRGVPDPLWIAATLDMLTMTYMLLPAGRQPAAVGYLLVGYLVCQFFARALGLWNRLPAAAAGAGVPEPDGAFAALAIGADGGDRRDAARTTVAAFRGEPGRPAFDLLPHYTPLVRVTLAVMAAGMAYMLIAMN